MALGDARTASPNVSHPWRAAGLRGAQGQDRIQLEMARGVAAILANRGSECVAVRSDLVTWSTREDLPFDHVPGFRILAPPVRRHVSIGVPARPPEGLCCFAVCRFSLS